MKQKRTLLLTNCFLYNIKDKDDIQRKIDVENIKGVTKSTKKGCTQFAVHVNAEYDYLYESDFRVNIFDALKWIFYNS